MRNWIRAGQKVDLIFLSPKLAHFAVKKFVRFRRSRVNARWNRARFCPCKIRPDLGKRGLDLNILRLAGKGKGMFYVAS